MDYGKNNNIEEVCYVHIKMFWKICLQSMKTITRILYCSSIQIDNQTYDGNSVILSPAVPRNSEKDLLIPGNYDAFISTAVGYFLKHVDLWKIKRAAQQHVNNDKTVRKE